MKLFCRGLVIFNAVVWAIVIWFPFSSFFSVSKMHWLSKAFSLACLVLFFAVLMSAVAVILVSYRSERKMRIDIALTLSSLLLNLFLFGAFGEGLL